MCKCQATTYQDTPSYTGAIPVIVLCFPVMDYSLLLLLLSTVGPGVAVHSGATGLVLATVAVGAQGVNKVLRKDIAAAAAESRDLAAELAAMLLRLEERGDKTSIKDKIGDDEDDDTTEREIKEQDNKKVSTEENDKEAISVGGSFNELNSRIEKLHNNSVQLVIDTEVENKENKEEDPNEFNASKQRINDNKDEVPENLEVSKFKTERISDSFKASDDLKKVESILNELSDRIAVLETDPQETVSTDIPVFEHATVKEGAEPALIVKGDEDKTFDILELGTRSDKATTDRKTLHINNSGDDLGQNIPPIVFDLKNADQGHFKEISKEKEEKDAKQERLRSSLDKLEKVAKEIEKLAKSAKSEEEIATVHQLTQILEEMATALTLEEVKLSVDLTLSKEQRKDTFEDLEESVDAMLEYFKEVMEQLKAQAAFNEQIARDNARARNPKFLKESSAIDAEIVADNEEKEGDEEKRLRQAKYRNMLTKFYFGSYWQIK